MKMKIPFFDLRVLEKNIKNDLNKSFNKVLNHGKFILGPEVSLLENEIAKKLNTKYAIAVSSGSSALYLCLKSLDFKKKDEIITTPLSWIISSNAILEAGAKPVFVDIDTNLNISPSTIEQAITKKTKAILVVHYAGLMCEMDKIKEIAKKYNLHIIEDAAQAFGANYRGIGVGQNSTLASLSFNSMKVLNSFGEAGAIVTNNKKLYEKIKILRYAGTYSDPKKIITNQTKYSSLNHKIDTIQAALILVMLKNLSKRMKRRNDIALEYNKSLSKYVSVPNLNKHSTHALYSYVIKTNKRDLLMKFLNDNGIETKIYHKPLISNSNIFKKFKKNKLPNANKFIKQILSLPSNEKLTDKQIKYIITKIKLFFQNNDVN